jgi:hypothetical protein
VGPLVAVCGIPAHAGTLAGLQNRPELPGAAKGSSEMHEFAYAAAAIDCSNPPKGNSTWQNWLRGRSQKDFAAYRGVSKRPLLKLRVRHRS